MPHPDEELKKEKFVPFATMFKLQEGICADLPRALKCVYCSTLVEWRIYTIDPSLFDKKCPECKMEASFFWKGKLHRELKDA